MDIRTAILKAADHIERRPNEFKFSSSSAPYGPGCGTPGCALGWVTSFAMEGCDRRGFIPFSDGIPMLGLHDHTEFYCRLSTAETGREFYADKGYGSLQHWAEGTFWHVRPEICARALRAYADLYHPADKGTRDCITLDPGFIAFREQFARAFESA